MEENKSTEQSQKINAIAMYFEESAFNNAQRVAGMLASSDLVPTNYQYHPPYPVPTDEAQKAANQAAYTKACANCLIALNKAAQLGCDPLTIMQNMTPIYGRPSWASSFLIGTVNSCGRFKPLKFKFGEDGEIHETYTVYKKDKSGMQKKVDMKNLTCYAYTTERGSDEELKGTTISLRMAFDEGWLTKDGSKWLTMPEQMLSYRAAAFWTRVYAPEISQGLYTIEETKEFTPYEELPTEVVPQIAADNANREVQGFDEKPAEAVEVEQQAEQADPKVEQQEGPGF